MQLSEHFTLEEFTRSDVATARKIANNPSSVQIKIMKHTCEYMLEVLRALLNEHYKVSVKIEITSGFRSLALNRAVGGDSSLEHLFGQAADIKVFKKINNQWCLVPYSEFYYFIKLWVRIGKLSVNQCILETSGNATWVHVSHHNAGKTRDKRVFLIYQNGNYQLDCKL